MLDMVLTSPSLQHTIAQTPEMGVLRVSEIFFSLQGETSRVGLPTIFVRLTGCPLRCSYCDTEYAFYGGEGMSISSILEEVDGRVVKVLDVKTPGSGEVMKNRWTNLEYLAHQDELKFVLCDEVDYQWAIQTMRKHRLDDICPVLFSPVYGKLDPALLASWVLRDRLRVRVQIQLHKLLWGEGPGR
jgi:7-carboxy-7-deazaguanine synthase